MQTRFGYFSSWLHPIFNPSAIDIAEQLCMKAFTADRQPHEQRNRLEEAAGQ